MTYRVIEGFYDLQDQDGKGNCHLYDKGDIYPREGTQPTEERIAELSGKDNKRSQPLIEEILEGIPQEEEIEEAPKKRRSRKAQ